MVVLASAVERFGLLLLVLPLLLAARSVRTLADRPPAAVRAAARRALAVLGVAGLLLAAWAAAAVAVALSPLPASASWLAAALLAGPLLGALTGTVPALATAARRPGSDPAVLGAVGVVLPARLLAVAAGAGAAVTVLAQPDVRALAVGVLLLVAVVVAVDTTQRARRSAGLPATLRWSPRARLAAPLVLVVAASGCSLASAAGSSLPASLSVGHHGTGAAAAAATTAGRDVTELVGAPTGPLRSFTLTADEAALPLASGTVVDVWTFDGVLPGTELRVTEGDTVEVRLVNRLDTAATTIHWHGVDVPNAMDGVAGVTQDAVPPGGTFTYRFTADRAGTYWYHAHQTSSEQVARGLFGALVVAPRDTAPVGLDRTVLYHEWDDRPALGAADEVERQAVAPGTPVRLRVVNTDSFSQDVRVTGTPYRLAALDGTDLVEPGELTAERVALGGGGRADVTFTMPAGPVRLSVGPAGLVLSPDGTALVEPPAPGPELDVTTYGRPAPTPFGPADRFDREHTIAIGEGLGFSRGGPDYLYTINGDVFPDVAPLTVSDGDLVRVTIANGGLSEHPMHLHGHHVLVLARDGRAATGSPVWLDTVLVRPGEVWEVAFRADNPGIWMDHCHVLFHAAAGMMLHLQYEGVTTRYDAGSASGNVPE